MVQVPSYVGVRSSFLLSSIAQLGRNHPPALAALRERRERAEARMMAETKDRTAAMDFASLNKAWGKRRVPWRSSTSCRRTIRGERR